MQSVFVQVINLDRSPERLAAIGADLDGLGARWARVAAVAPPADYAGTVQAYQRQRANYLFGRDLTRGELGCALSHLAALRSLQSGGDDVGLILEDDAMLDPAAGQTIAQIIACLAVNEPDWACVNLSYATDLRRRPLAHLPANVLYRAYQFPLLSSALLWQKQAAGRFVAWCEAVGIYAPFDNQLRDWIALGNRGISCDKPPVGLRMFPSTIADRPGTGAAQPHKAGSKFSRYELRQKLPLYWRSGKAYLIGR